MLIGGRQSIKLYMILIRSSSLSSSIIGLGRRINSSFYIQFGTAASASVKPNHEETSSTDNKSSSSLRNKNVRSIDNDNDNKSNIRNDKDVTVVEVSEDKSWIGKLLYNSYLESFNTDAPKGYRQKFKARSQKPEQEHQKLLHADQNQIPVALQLLLKDSSNTSQDDQLNSISSSSVNNEDEINDHDDDDAVYSNKSTDSYNAGKLQFPYRFLTSVELNPANLPDASQTHPYAKSDNDDQLGKPRSKIEPTPASDANYEWFKEYGTPDSSIPPSKHPCGGCGAILHCQDTSIPGFVPSERFKVLSHTELIREICQRCYFLQEHNAALNVNISKDDYPKILSQIKEKFALVLLLVDLLDFPCSIWPGMIDIIGTKRPVIIVGNKVDLLPQDQPQFLRHVKDCLYKSCQEMGLDQANIIDVALVSATTGYGVESLIDSIFHRWGNKGDICIMGCTNVGKSSLFNAFLQSDLCKIRAVDLIQRATISQWPGTTLNLLKFPVTRPSSYRMGVRSSRLHSESESKRAHDTLRRIRTRETRTLLNSTLVGHIGQSFVDREKLEKVEEMNTFQDMFHFNPKSKAKPSVLNKIKSRDQLEEEFKESNWCFDTPGAVAENQLLEELTLPELMDAIPKQIIEPRTYLLKIGWTLFVGGLARIDYLKGFRFVRLTLFTTSQLPVTVVLSEDADYVYQKGLGTTAFGVPRGDKERLDQFPPLKGSDVELEGDGNKCSCADIVISSTGWVAVTGALGEDILLRAYTPNGKGIFCRKPSLLPYSVNLKGKRIRGTPAYNPTRVFLDRNI